MPNPIMQSRIVIWPRGGGEILEQFDSDMPEEVMPARMLAYFQGILGNPPLEIAYTDGPVGESIAIGWVFPVPPSFEVPGPLDEFELVVIPMVQDPESPEDLVPFAIETRRELAELKDLQRQGLIDEVFVISLDQELTDDVT